MLRKKWLLGALLGIPVAVVGGLAYAKTSQTPSYTCPLTGEELPCPKCCPVNSAGTNLQTTEGYTCPLTGEKLNCEKCCPLDAQK